MSLIYPTSVVIGTRNAAQAIEDIRAAGVMLDDELTRGSPRGAAPRYRAQVEADCLSATVSWSSDTSWTQTTSLALTSLPAPVANGAVRSLFRSNSRTDTCAKRKRVDRENALHVALLKQPVFAQKTSVL